MATSHSGSSPSLVEGLVRFRKPWRGSRKAGWCSSSHPKTSSRKLEPWRPSLEPACVEMDETTRGSGVSACTRASKAGGTAASLLSLSLSLSPEEATRFGTRSIAAEDAGETGRRIAIPSPIAGSPPSRSRPSHALSLSLSLSLPSSLPWFYSLLLSLSLLSKLFVFTPARSLSFLSAGGASPGARFSSAKQGKTDFLLTRKYCTENTKMRNFCEMKISISATPRGVRW